MKESCKWKKEKVAEAGKGLRLRSVSVHPHCVFTGAGCAVRRVFLTGSRSPFCAVWFDSIWQSNRPSPFPQPSRTTVLTTVLKSP